MNKLYTVIISTGIVVFLLMGSGAFYIVDETNQVVITQFGEPIGQPIKDAGLYFKTRFVQTANSFDKRSLSWDGDPH